MSPTCSTSDHSIPCVESTAKTFAISLIFLHVGFLIIGTYSTVTAYTTPSFLFLSMCLSTFVNATLNFSMMISARSLWVYVPLTTDALWLIVEWMATILFNVAYFVVAADTYSSLGIVIAVVQYSSQLFLALYLSHSATVHRAVSLHFAALAVFNFLMVMGDVVFLLDRKLPTYISKSHEEGGLATLLTFTLLGFATGKFHYDMAIVFARKVLFPHLSVLVRVPVLLQSKVGLTVQNRVVLAVVIAHAPAFLLGGVSFGEFSNDPSWSIPKALLIVMSIGLIVNGLICYWVAWTDGGLQMARLTWMPFLLISEFIGSNVWLFAYFIMGSVLSWQQLFQIASDVFQSTGQLMLVLSFDDISKLRPSTTLLLWTLAVYNILRLLGDFVSEIRVKMPQEAHNTMLWRSTFTVLWAVILRFRWDMAVVCLRKLSAPDVSVFRRDFADIQTPEASIPRHMVDRPSSFPGATTSSLTSLHMEERCIPLNQFASFSRRPWWACPTDSVFSGRL